MDFRRLSPAQRVSAISIAVVAIAAFLPWVSFLGFSKSGLKSDGVITLVIAVIGAGLLLVKTGFTGGSRTLGKKSKIALLVLAALVAIIGIADMNGAAAIGLYLTLFAGLAWVVGAVWDLNSASTGATTTRADAASVEE